MGCINALLNKLKLKEQKDNLVMGFTGQRTSSRGGMFKAEAIELIRYLKSQDPDEVAAERMRKKVISMAHECGYRIPGTKKVDMKKLDGWCTTFGMYKKKLNQHTKEEMVNLVTQFEQRYKSFLSSL